MQYTQSVLLTPFTVTGLFFHQAELAAGKGWSLGWFALSFVVYAGTSVVGTLASGPLIDRFSAARPLPSFLLPLLGALWAELYGVLHLGAIRSFVWALVAFASAIAAALFGYLTDAGTRIGSIAGGCLIAAFAAALLAGVSRLPKRWTRGI